MVSHRTTVPFLLISSLLLQLLSASLPAAADNDDLHYRTFKVAPDSIDGVIDSAQTTPPHLVLTGGISNSASFEARAIPGAAEEPNSADLSEQFNNMWRSFMTASFQTPESKKYDQQVDRFSLKRMYLKERSTDALNSVFMFNGVSASSQAGDVILDEKLKIDSVGAAKYARQKHVDELELRTMQNLLQMAMVLGTKDSPENSKQFTEARNSLIKLGGPQAADRAIASLRVLCRKRAVDYQDAASWSITTTQGRVEKTIQAAALRDPIVDEIKADVHKYNQHGGLTSAAHKVVRVALNVSSLMPNMIGPASQAVLFGYVVLSGGTEQSKIMKELYMEKRLASRAGLLSEEAQLAFHQYQLGSATNNLALVACSEMMVSRMVGADAAQKLLHGTTAPQTKFASAGTIE